MNKRLFVSLQCLQTGILLNYFLVYFIGIIYNDNPVACEKTSFNKNSGRIAICANSVCFIGTIRI